MESSTTLILHHDDNVGENEVPPLNFAENDVPEENYSYHSEELRSPISTDDENNGNGNDVFPQFNPNATFGQVTLDLGMEFETLKAFKDAVRDYTIYEGKEMKWVKNDKERCRAECKGEKCDWMIFCSWNGKRKSFQVKTFVKDHTCSRDFINSQANTEWVSKKLEDKIRMQPSITYAETFDYMKTKYGVQINDTKLFRSLKKAREKVEGNYKEQYGLIWDYAKELQRSNPGTTAKIDTTPVSNGPPQFKRFYVCLDACKRGFLAGCRPLIGLDGCFLKGYYGGQLLSAVGSDANNQNFVIAYAIVEVENKENWKWFLTLLQNDLGCYREHGWNFMSDMQKGLIVPLCPMQQSKLEKLKIQSNKWTPLSAGDGRFQVANAWNSHVDVDIKSNTCTCRKWQLTGMPCEHACAAIAWMREKPEDYCHGWLTLEAYNATYKFCVRPAEGQEYWEPTDYIRPVPAPIRKRPGRPKKARRKDANEEGTSSRRTKIKRAYQTKHCSRCGLEGHTMNRCSGQGVNHMPRGWVIICERCGIEGHYMFQGCNGQGVDPMPLNLISTQPMENVPIDMDDTHGPLPTQVTQPDEFDVEPIPLGVKPTPMRGPRPMRGPGFNPPRFNPPRAPRPWR